MKFKNFLCTVLIMSPCFLFAQSVDNILHVKRTKDFAIKGDGSAANWNSIEWMTLTQRKGTPKQTQLKLLYSDSGMYCLYKCMDAKITATLKEDFADLYNEDVVEAFFWTEEKFPVYFEYEVSPLNYELPIMVPNNNGNFFGWLPWHYADQRKTRHATQINKEGDNIISWTAEFFIPFALLKPLPNVPPQKGTKWRANFYRIDYDETVTAQWSWQLTRKNFHDYEKFGTLVFE